MTDQDTVLNALQHLDSTKRNALMAFINTLMHSQYPTRKSPEDLKVELNSIIKSVDSKDLKDIEQAIHREFDKAKLDEPHPSSF